MATGLSLNDPVNVQVSLTPKASPTRNFGNLLIQGDSDVIDTFERQRLYVGLNSIANDFGGTAPEYLAAVDFFAQEPQPSQCYVGRWASSAVAGRLRGAVLGATQQVIGNFTVIVAGGMTVFVDGAEIDLVNLNFSAQNNLNGIATIVQGALGAAATCIWDANNSRFVIKSATTGANSSVSYATPPASGPDISLLLGLRFNEGGVSVNGQAAESLLNSFIAQANQSANWYGIEVASTANPSNQDMINAAAFIEAANLSHIYGITTQDPGTMDPSVTTDLVSQLKALGYKRTFAQYSSGDENAASSIFGRMFTVNFDGFGTTLTAKFKTEPGVAPESLTEGQAAGLDSKNCNYFVNYQDGSAIIQQGVMVNGYFFDEVHGTDWLQNALQTAVYNLLRSVPKIAQTDKGMTKIAATLSTVLEQAVNNGFVAPGVWTGPDMGAISNGDTLAKGYYVFIPAVSTQTQADREARKAPVIQIAIKLAGAVHFVDIIVNVNR